MATSPPTHDEIVEKIRSHPKLVVAEDYELCVQRESVASEKHRNGERVEKSADEKLWVSLRVLHRRRPGCAAVRVATPLALSRLVDEAFDSAERASVDPWFRFPIWRKPKTNEMPAETPTLTLPTSLYERIAIPPTALEERYESELVDTLLLRRTEKLELRHVRKTDRLRFSVVYPTTGGFEQLREERAFARPLPEREAWLEGILRRALAYSEAPVFSGEESAAMLLSPVLVSALLARMSEWFLGDRAQARLSPLTPYLDRQIFSDAITLVDDGGLAGAPGAMPFDLEGTLTQETVLVEKGRLRQFLFDTYHATRENRVSTGNFFRRSDSVEPRIDNGTMYVRPSASTTEDLVAQLSEGFLLESIDSLESLGGAFGSEVLLVASGWCVEGGRRAYPIRSVPCRMDLLNVWQDALVVGDDLQFFDRYGAPSILFRKIPLGI